MNGSVDIRPRFRLTIGELTRLKVDAIVNAANTSLLGAAGLTAPSIGLPGPGLLAEFRKTGGCPPVEARSTGVVVSRPRTLSTGLARSGGVEQPPNNKSWRYAIARALKSLAPRDFAVSHSLLSRQAPTPFRAKQPPASPVTTIGSHRAERQLPELVIFLHRHGNFERLMQCGRLWRLR